MNNKPTTQLSREMILPNSANPQIWARFIGAKAESAVASIIDCGRALIAAKVELGVGDWGRMFADSETPVLHPIPFTVRSASRLMAIASNPILTDVARGPLLPASWRTLYELTKLPNDRLEESFKRGEITPDMTREEVRRLVNPITSDRPTRPPTPRRVERLENAELWEITEAKLADAVKALDELKSRGFELDFLSGRLDKVQSLVKAGARELKPPTR